MIVIERKLFSRMALPLEEDRPRWGGRSSKPVEAVRRSRAGSTPVLFRQARVIFLASAAHFPMFSIKGQWSGTSNPVGLGALRIADSDVEEADRRGGTDVRCVVARGSGRCSSRSEGLCVEDALAVCDLTFGALPAARPGIEQGEYWTGRCPESEWLGQQICPRRQLRRRGRGSRHPRG